MFYIISCIVRSHFDRIALESEMFYVGKTVDYFHRFTTSFLPYRINKLKLTYIDNSYPITWPS